MPTRPNLLRRLGRPERPAPESGPDSVEVSSAPGPSGKWKKKVVLAAAAVTLLAGAAGMASPHAAAVVQSCAPQQVTVQAWGQGPNSSLWGVLENAGYSDQQINFGGNLLQPGQVLILPGSTCTSPNPFHDQFQKAAQVAGVPAQWADDPARVELSSRGRERRQRSLRTLPDAGHHLARVPARSALRQH